MELTSINGRWDINLPDHRAARPEWPWWEKPRLESMFMNLDQGDLIYDIGAEEGDMSGLYVLWGCEVVLFEPNPRVWPNIKAVWEGNDLAPPRGWFVGFAGPEDDFVRPDWPAGVDRDGWPECAYGALIGDHGFLNICERPDCPTITIDTFAAEHGAPDAITIDIEGAELLALRGAEATLKEHKPFVWVSVHPDFMRDMYGQHFSEVTEFMASCGYNEYHLAAEHEHHRFYWHKDGRLPMLPYGDRLEQACNDLKT